jgi:hypothetical protein
MTSVPETPIQAWDRSFSVDVQLQRLVEILAGTLGVVLVALLAWVILLVVR